MTRTARFVDEISYEEIENLTGPRVWPSRSALRPCDRFIHRRPEIPFIVARKRILSEVQQGIPMLSVRMIILEGGQNFVKGSTHTMHVVLQGESDIDDVRMFLKALRINLKKHVEQQAKVFKDSVKLDFIKGKSALMFSWQEKWL